MPAGQQGGIIRDTRAYIQEEGAGKKGYDDLAYYEGRYASQMRGQDEDASSTAVLEARNPARAYQRRY